MDKSKYGGNQGSSSNYGGVSKSSNNSGGSSGSSKQDDKKLFERRDKKPDYSSKEKMIMKVPAGAENRNKPDQKKK